MLVWVSSVNMNMIYLVNSSMKEQLLFLKCLMTIWLSYHLIALYVKEIRKFQEFMLKTQANAQISIWKLAAHVTM